jgi:hypothetical protein
MKMFFLVNQGIFTSFSAVFLDTLQRRPLTPIADVISEGLGPDRLSTIPDVTDEESLAQSNGQDIPDLIRCHQQNRLPRPSVLPIHSLNSLNLSGQMGQTHGKLKQLVECCEQDLVSLLVPLARLAKTA